MNTPSTNLIDRLNWDKVNHLMPAIVQNAATQQVLMLGYMNQEALKKTLDTNQVTFYSRTKERLWTKGETSNHTLELIQIIPDCDEDALLILAKPTGPTCHRNTSSCFGEEDAPGVGFLAKLDAIVQERFETRPDNSYTTKLFESGTKHMAQKVGEEGVEVALAALADSDEDFLGECSDLLFHLLVMVRQRNLSLEEVIKVMSERHRAFDKKG